LTVSYLYASVLFFFISFFSFNATATPEIYTLSLHDALPISGTVVLQNNGGDNLTISVNGAFTFAAALINASPYAVTVLAQPAGQTCTVANGVGTLAGANVTNVTVTCAANDIAVAGSSPGLRG